MIKSDGGLLDEVYNIVITFGHRGCRLRSKVLCPCMFAIGVPSSLDGFLPTQPPRWVSK